MTHDYGKKGGWTSRKFVVAGLACGVGLTAATPTHVTESRTFSESDTRLGQTTMWLSQDWELDLLGLFDLLCMYLGCPNDALISGDGETKAWAFVSMASRMGAPVDLNPQERAFAIGHIEVALDIVDAFEADLPCPLVEALVATLMNLQAALRNQAGQTEGTLP